jgi:hypothetical protein
VVGDNRNDTKVYGARSRPVLGVKEEVSMLEELELLDLVGKMITGPAVSHFRWTVAEVTVGVTADLAADAFEAPPDFW